jgi:hypothetical protein
MTRTTLVLAALALMLGSVEPAQAGILYSNGSGNVSGNNPFTYEYVAQDFTLAQNSLLQQLTFNVYTTASTTPPTAAHVNIHSNVGGSVGSVLFSGDFSVIETGITGSSGGYTFRDYTVALPSWSLPGGSYYLGLDVDPTQWDFHWTITSYSQIGGPSYQSPSGLPGTYSGYSFEHAFTLSGNDGIAAVPEPSSLALIGMASASFAGYAGWRRRRQPAAA